MSDPSSQRTHRRRVLMALGAFGVVIAAVSLVTFLPEYYQVMLFGKTVDHCPNSGLACNSQQPGLLFLVAIPFLAYALWKEDPDEQ